MVSFVIIIFCVMVALGFGAAAAFSDYSRLTIPNSYPLFIGGAFILAYFIFFIMAPDSGYFFTITNHLIAGGAVFAVSFALFAVKAIGGGDAKLLSVYSLWVGMQGLMPLFFFMAVAGGILALMTMQMNKKPLFASPNKDTWIYKAQSGHKHVPYGIAIFIGALASFWASGYLNPQKLMALAGG